ncbi:MAG: polysaccharide deacetylase family protein [Phascolarctobacterium sp.]
MKWTTGLKIFFLVLFVGLASYAYHFFADTGVKTGTYANVPDLSSAYQADEEITAALQKLQDKNLIAATVVTHKLDGKREIALTFDGLPRKETLVRLLDVLEKHQAKATFFAEGGNVALSPQSMEALEKKGQSVGNYTFIGLSKLEQQSESEAVKQLCMAQKVFSVTSNFQPSLFKAPKTRNTIPLLKVAAACGLKSGVKTDVFVPKDQLVTLEAAGRFVGSVPPGSIVSLVVNRGMEPIVQKAMKVDDRPAIDKKPGLELSGGAKVRHESIVDVTDRLLTACEQQGVKIVPLASMRTVRLAEPATPAQKPQQPVGKLSMVQQNLEKIGIAQQTVERLSMLWQDGCARGLRALDVFASSVAHAAPQKTSSKYDGLRQQNAGRLAEEQRMLLTTEPAIAFCFAGWERPESTKAVLDRLQKLNAHATFFVGAKDIPTNEALLRRALSEGHELGIAVYAWKSGSFATVCRQIEDTSKLLRQKFGVETDLVKQPWGKVEDYTKEAVSAMGCKLISQNVNMVQSRHKDYTTANEILPELFGKFVHSLGRGWIVNFRMDYYTNSLLCADVMQLLKEKKIDNIAYWSFEDDPERNPRNNSAYAIKSVGSILANEKYTYALPVTEEKMAEELRPAYSAVADMPLRQYIQERYIGTDTVNVDSNTLGFTQEELRLLDTTGVLHTNRPAIFLGFDDWGTDAAINQLLYVLRKHRVKGTFFILARNVKNNPNLLRAIAEEGHDIACHTYNHKPMAVVGKHEHLYSVQNSEEKLEDYRQAYAELAKITGDVKVEGKYSLTRMFRPPTLTISKQGFRALQQAGYDFIVSGSTSTHDYEAENLYAMMDNIRAGLYEKGQVKKGAVFVMHMSDSSKFTARALDVLLTNNERKHVGDPTRFEVGRLSDYLVAGYSQAAKTATLNLQSNYGQ